jgi:hypothetical protein
MAAFGASAEAVGPAVDAVLDFVEDEGSSTGATAFGGLCGKLLGSQALCDAYLMTRRFAGRSVRYCVR